MTLDSTYFGNGIVMILAIAIVIFILIWFSFKLEKEHIFLKVFCLIMAVFLLYLIPKTAIDYSGDCVIMVENATTIGSTTTFSYISECSKNSSTTDVTFLKTTSYITIFFSLYMIVFYIYMAFKNSWDYIKNMKL